VGLIASGAMSVSDGALLPDVRRRTNGDEKGAWRRRYTLTGSPFAEAAAPEGVASVAGLAVERDGLRIVLRARSVQVPATGAVLLLLL